MQAVPLPPRTVQCRHAGKDFSREKVMKRFLTFLTAAFAAVLVCATMAPGAEVKTDYFTLNLPEGWIQPRSPQVPEGGLMVIVQNPAEQSAVSIAVTPVPLPAKELAAQTFANMKAGGFTVSEPRPSGDSYVGEFSRSQTGGVSYFSSNGRLGCVVTIVGSDTAKGRELLNNNLKPVDARLFPSSY